MADHIQPDNSVAGFLKSFSTSQERILDVDMDVIRRANLAAECPVELLPWLAWERSVDEYMESWPVEVRRAVVAGSFAYHKTKGTTGALKRALGSLGFETNVSEWFQHGGAPYTFRVRAIKRDGGTLSFPEFMALYRLIMSAKNVRSHLDAIETAAEYATPVPRIAAYAPSQTIRVTLSTEGA